MDETRKPIPPILWIAFLILAQGSVRAQSTDAKDQPASASQTDVQVARWKFFPFFDFEFKTVTDPEHETGGARDQAEDRPDKGIYSHVKFNALGFLIRGESHWPGPNHIEVLDIPLTQFYNYGIDIGERTHREMSLVSVFDRMEDRAGYHRTKFIETLWACVYFNETRPSGESKWALLKTPVLTLVEKERVMDEKSLSLLHTPLLTLFRAKRDRTDSLSGLAFLDLPVLGPMFEFERSGGERKTHVFFIGITTSTIDWQDDDHAPKS